VKGTGEYPDNWAEISEQVRREAHYRCERCAHPNDPGHGYTLTVHHLDGNKSNNQRWNSAALCQRCHLTIQGKVFMAQFYMFGHTDWFKPHAEGYYKSITEG